MVGEGRLKAVNLNTHPGKCQTLQKGGLEQLPTLQISQYRPHVTTASWRRGGGVQSAPIFGTSPTPHQHQDIPEIIPGLIKEHGGGTPPQNATHTHTHTQKIMACRFIQDPGT